VAPFEAIWKYYRFDNKGRSLLCFILSGGAAEVDEGEGGGGNKSAAAFNVLMAMNMIAAIEIPCGGRQQRYEGRGAAVFVG
jgi:hypothetical protein